MTKTFTLYVDESGDAGLKPNSTDWFVLSGLATHVDYDHNLPKIMKEIRKSVKLTNLNKPLHFRDLKDEQKLKLLEAIARMEVVSFSVIVYKPMLQNPSEFKTHPHKLFFSLSNVYWNVLLGI